MKQLVWLCLFPALLLAQAIEISGYFEPQITGIAIQNQFYNFSANKLRVDLHKDFDRVSFGANVNYITYHGKTEWNVLDYLPTRVTQDIPEALHSYYVFHYGDMAAWNGVLPEHRADRIFLDNVYLKMRLLHSDLIIGKQQLSFGSGYSWNPTDLFNSKNILDPTYEQPGHNAIRWMLQLGQIHHVDVIYAPGEQWQDSGKMLRYSTSVGHFDVAATAAQVNWTHTNYDMTDLLTEMPNITELADASTLAPTFTRHMLGMDFSGQLFGLGVWSELAYNFKDESAAVPQNTELLVGMDYTFANSLYLMAEWFHSSAAPQQWQNYTLNDWMRMFTAENKSVCRDQLYAMAMYPLTDLLTINLSTIASLSDGSLGVVPMLMWNVFEDVECNIFGYFYTGAPGRLYAANMGNGAMLRFRFYF